MFDLFLDITFNRWLWIIVWDINFHIIGLTLIWCINRSLNLDFDLLVFHKSFSFYIDNAKEILSIFLVNLKVLYKLKIYEVGILELLADSFRNLSKTTALQHRNESFYKSKLLLQRRLDPFIQWLLLHIGASTTCHLAIWQVALLYLFLLVV